MYVVAQAFLSGVRITRYSERAFVEREARNYSRSDSDR